MSITTNTIRLAAIARDQAGHGTPGSMSDLDHLWVAPGHHYGLGFDGFKIVGVRDLADDGDECYLIALLDMGDVEDLRDEARAAGDVDQYETCVAALEGATDALLQCVERILDAQIEALAG